MIRSMTGYGRKRDVNDGKDILFEIKSVNSRYLDANIKYPRSFGTFEEKIKQLISKYISRGKIDVYLSIENIEGENNVLSLNKEYLEMYVSVLKQISEEYNVPGTIDLRMLSQRSDIFISRSKEPDSEAVWAAVEPIATAACEAYLAMRETEGEKLKEDVSSHLDAIEAIAARIAETAPVAVAAANEKMIARVRKLLDNVPYDEARLLTECAVFADKTDISEELVRLGSHISQFRSILCEDIPVGRKLDFLVQELNREVNTIGSKANDIDIAKLVIEAKSEIEKIREQIQNIE